MRVSQKSALILTPALTDGSFSLISWRSLDGQLATLQDAAFLALNEATIPWAQSLSKALYSEHMASLPKPLAFHNDRVVGTTYHHGSDHAHYAIGPLSAVLQVCAASENEREIALQFARQQTTLGHVCYAVAKGHSKSDITSLSQLKGAHRLDLLGMVVVKPTLYPNTLHRLSRIREEYSALHYLATGDEYYIGAVAVLSKLMAPSEEIIVRKDSIAQKRAATIILPKRDFDALIKSRTYSHLYSSPLS